MGVDSSRDGEERRLAPVWEWRHRRAGSARAVAMLELRLPPGIRAPATARSELVELPLGKSEREAMLLLASELVTNCVRHAGLASTTSGIGHSRAIKPRSRRNACATMA
jgi:hypothetical protein